MEKRELKPRARIPDQEYELHNTFLVVFVEDAIPPEHKKYIRFFEENRTTKVNLLRVRSRALTRQTRPPGWRYLESIHFRNFIRALLPVDYALLIQRDPVEPVPQPATISRTTTSVSTGRSAMPPRTSAAACATSRKRFTKRAKNAPRTCSASCSNTTASRSWRAGGARPRSWPPSICGGCPASPRSTRAAAVRGR
ncbi:MAG: hypothetical protein MZV70_64245 [Desulfobacterales bacterium]|nr:hypothetical protein [Desulfobacterales bacterium]